MHHVRHPKPIAGFGAVGWVAAVILLALAGVATTGYDVQAAYLWIVGDVIGDGNVTWYMARFHVWHGLWIGGDTSFGLLTMIPVVVAMRVHPARFGWWRYALIVIWALTHPLWWMTKSIRRVMSDVIEAGAPGLSFASVSSITYGVLELATVIVLLVATRSWRLALALLALVVMTTATCAAIAPAGGVAPGPPMPIVIGWQLAFAAMVLTWGIQARLHERGPGDCQACGYSMRGLGSTTCPECGVVA